MRRLDRPAPRRSDTGADGGRYQRRKPIVASRALLDVGNEILIRTKFRLFLLSYTIKLSGSSQPEKNTR